MNNIKALLGCFLGSRQLGQTLANNRVTLTPRNFSLINGIIIIQVLPKI